MKNLKSILLSACVLLFAGTVSAQKIKVISGDIAVLKTETSLNTEFTYDANIQVGKKTEKTYVAEKKSELNKKEPGRGDMWALAGLVIEKLNTNQNLMNYCLIMVILLNQLQNTLY